MEKILPFTHNEQMHIWRETEQNFVTQTQRGRLIMFSACVKAGGTGSILLTKGKRWGCETGRLQLLQQVYTPKQLKISNLYMKLRYTVLLRSLTFNFSCGLNLLAGLRLTQIADAAPGEGWRRRPRTEELEKYVWMTSSTYKSVFHLSKIINININIPCLQISKIN